MPWTGALTVDTNLQVLAYGYSLPRFQVYKIMSPWREVHDGSRAVGSRAPS